MATASSHLQTGEEMSCQNPSLFEISWWGWSPCINLMQELVDIWHDEDLSTSYDVLNVLLVGSSDPRHILKTMGEHHTWDKVGQLNIYIIEQTLEQLTRQCLLLALALNTDDQSSLHEKTIAYLEAFGNTLLSCTTYEHFRKQSKALIEFSSYRRNAIIVDGSIQKNNLEIIKFEELKHKDRDAMEATVKFWLNQTHNTFPISHLWDLRLRQSLNDRYDSRFNIFDWDYHMKLQSRGCPNIIAEEYIRWRDSGVAFNFQKCVIPNRTLASTRMHQKKEYFGDITTGPFIAFGIECDDERVFKKENRVPVKTSQDISYTNVFRFLQQIQDNFTAKGKVKIHLLSPDAIFKIHAKKRYNNKFHLVYFSRNTIQVMNSRLNEIMAINGLILTETCRFAMRWRKEEIEDIQKQTDDILRLANYKAVRCCNPLQDNHASFIRNNP